MNSTILISSLSLALLQINGFAQEGPPHRPKPPIIAALDADDDGIISAEEIEQAVAALKGLDANNDGELSPDELHPPREGNEGGHRNGPPPNGKRGGERNR